MKTHLVLFEVLVQVAALAELQHGGKGVGVDLKDVQQRHNARM